MNCYISRCSFEVKVTLRTFRRCCHIGPYIKLEHQYQPNGEPRANND